MRLKKGFTLAEILIVLMVIGVIATMTLPALMRGVQETQFKTSYKKAFNTISNWATMEKAAGSLPTKGTITAALDMYKSLNSNLSVSAYASQAIDAGTGVGNSGIYTGMQVTDGTTTTTFGNSTDAPDSAVTIRAVTSGAIDKTNDVPWMITEDGFAYTVLYTSSNKCLSKIELNGQKALKTAVTKSCFVVIVDVNGITKAPNRLATFKPESGSLIDTYDTAMADNVKMDTLVNDQFPILVGEDGATAGHKVGTLTGRIVSDVK